VFLLLKDKDDITSDYPDAKHQIYSFSQWCSK
jgi:hypothetical protein